MPFEILPQYYMITYLFWSPIPSYTVNRLYSPSTRDVTYLYTDDYFDSFNGTMTHTTYLYTQLPCLLYSPFYNT